MVVRSLNKNRLENIGWNVATDDEDALIMFKVNESRSCVDIYIEESGTKPIVASLVKEEVSMIYDELFGN